MNKRTQGRQFITLLKKRGMTSMELLQLGISTCWWKRVAESLAPSEELRPTGTKMVNGKACNVYRVFTTYPRVAS